MTRLQIWIVRKSSQTKTQQFYNTFPIWTAFETHNVASKAKHIKLTIQLQFGQLSNALTQLYDTCLTRTVFKNQSW